MMFRRVILAFAVALDALSFCAAEGTGVDIGPATPAGSFVVLSPGSYNVTGAGSDIWGSQDQFHFLHFPERTADVTLTVFVESFVSRTAAALNYWAKAGLMIRDDLTPESAHASAFVIGGMYVAMQGRDTAWGSSFSYHSANVGTHRVWLRLTKEGKKLTSYYKLENDLTYTKYYTRDIIFSAGGFYVGIPVTSHSNGNPATLKVRNFEISDEVFTFPARDVGEVGRAVEAQETVPGSWAIKGSGNGIGGTSDSFAFLQYKQSGIDAVAEVHLDKLEDRNLDSKGGLMIRVANTPDSPHVSLLTTRRNGLTMYYRKTVGGPTESKNVGVWDSDMELKLEKTGNDVAVSYKHVSMADWYLLGTATGIEFGPDYYVGLAVSSADYWNHATLRTGHLYVDGQAVSSSA